MREASAVAAANVVGEASAAAVASVVREATAVAAIVVITTVVHMEVVAVTTTMAAPFRMFQEHEVSEIMPLSWLFSRD